MKMEKRNKEETMDRTASDLLDTFSDPEVQEDVEKVKHSDPMDMLRNDILTFFQTHMERIRKQETLRNSVQEKLHNMIESDELSFDQLMRVFSMVSKEENTAAESIISLFRPVPGAGSLLANSLGQDKKDDEIDNVYKNLTSEQIRSIDHLYRAIQSEHGEGGE